jgi:hypothetical protein
MKKSDNNNNHDNNVFEKRLRQERVEWRSLVGRMQDNIVRLSPVNIKKESAPDKGRQ